MHIFKIGGPYVQPPEDVYSLFLKPSCQDRLRLSSIQLYFLSNDHHSMIALPVVKTDTYPDTL